MTLKQDGSKLIQRCLPARLPVWIGYLPSTIDGRDILPFLARLFSKKTSRYCHSAGVIGGVVGGGVVRKLTFSNISVIIEDIHLKLRIVVHYQKGNPYQ